MSEFKRDPQTPPPRTKGVRKALDPLQKRRKTNSRNGPFRPGDSQRRRRARRSPANFYIFPNLFTSASLFLALYSITKSAEGIAMFSQGEMIARESFIAACWAILLAAVCDAIDGPVARITRTTSSFGLEYDSLADVVAFGVAPAFLMFANLQTMDEAMLPDYAPKLALGACALFAICAAIRLARFNVQAETTERRHFTGLPTPGAAGTVVSAYLFVEWLSDLPFIENFEDPAWIARLLHRCILILMVGIALLMVSEIPFRKLRRLLPITKKPFNTLVVLIALFCMAIAFSYFIPVFLFAAFLVYIGGAVLASLRDKTPLPPSP